ncbi:SDR family NAD(P)-dependent oxidoreductase [Microbacterium sp. E-13]|uniref:SDR family NAD(P)-dependent oxidoreductase n=1 Tax=Microbacterium sp. E-13 TaxID=3404048 RepID=UPI003CED0C92
MSKLSGLTAIITGAASGIGQAAALRLAQEGAPVALLDREGIQRTQTLIEDAGGTAVGIELDVTDAEAVDAAVTRVINEVGSPRVLVNAAGVVIRKGLLTTSTEEFEQVLRINVVGSFHLLRAVVPSMTEAGGGSIVQIASSSAHLGGHGYPSYTASKGAVLSMTRMLANELAPRGIRINSVSPGATLTPINVDTFSVLENRIAMEGAIPMGRLGRPEDIAGAIAYLAGPDSAYVTGTDLPVDGGLISRITMVGANSYSSR